MKDDPTIFADRETVELLAAQPQLLAIADAVRATQRAERRAWNVRPSFLAAAAVMAGLAAVLAFAFTGASGKQGERVSLGHQPKAALVFYNGSNWSLGDLAFATPTAADVQAISRPAATWAMKNARLAYTVAAYDDWHPGLYYLSQAGVRVERVPSGVASKVAVTVFHPPLHGRAHVQVLTGTSPWKRVVFSQELPLSPAEPYRSRATLSPYEWSGGCRKGRYWVSVTVSPADMLLPEWAQPRFWSRPFTCRR